MRGFITLGQIADRLPALDVSCNRCARSGRLRTSRLVAEHGPDFPGPSLRQILAADCPKMIANEMHDPCGIHFPEMSERF